MIRECKICGKWFDSSSKNNTLCSQECKAISKKENSRNCARKRSQRNKIQIPKNADKIIEVNTQAKAKGMSYGQYVAYLSMQEEKRN